MISDATPLVLGSGSPRRREILETLRIPLRVQTADAEETRLPDDTVDRYLRRVVQAKWDAVTAMTNVQGQVVLVADTMVSLEDNLLGKPRDEEHAREMLTLLSGRDHAVFTRFAVGVAGQAPRDVRTVRTTVTFRHLSEDAIARYARTGEGLDKAGAYAIQGIGVFAVAAMHGSYTNVVGLPAGEVVDALVSCGFLKGFPL